jgi:hypothetical protein
MGGMNDDDGTTVTLRQIGAEGLHVAGKIAVRIDEDESGAAGPARQLLHEQSQNGRFAGPRVPDDLNAAGAFIEEYIEIQKFRLPRS